MSVATSFYRPPIADQGQLARRALAYVRAAMRAPDPAEERQSVQDALWAVADLAVIVDRASFNEPARKAVRQAEQALELARGNTVWLTVASDLLGRLAHGEGSR